ncbi:MAG: hypothetical protein VW441_08600 [Flavobacteriaceae bacterium]
MRFSKFITLPILFSIIPLKTMAWESKPNDQIVLNFSNAAASKELTPTTNMAKIFSSGGIVMGLNNSPMTKTDIQDLPSRIINKSLSAMDMQGKKDLKACSAILPDKNIIFMTSDTQTRIVAKINEILPNREGSNLPSKSNCYALFRLVFG